MPHYGTDNPALPYVFSMAKESEVVSRLKALGRRRIFLREWRKYRGLTQEQLADRAEMSTSNISQLERGLQGWSDVGLAALADALSCEPGHLLMVDPTKDDAMWSIWERAKPAQRLQIVEIAKTLLKTGTE